MGIEPCIVKGDGGPADGVGDVVSQASQGCRGDCWGEAWVVAVESGWWKEVGFSLSSFQAQNHLSLFVCPMCMSHNCHNNKWQWATQRQHTTIDHSMFQYGIPNSHDDLHHFQYEKRLPTPSQRTENKTGHVSFFIFILFGFTNDFFLQLDDLYWNHDNDDGQPGWMWFEVSFLM